MHIETSWSRRMNSTLHRDANTRIKQVLETAIRDRGEIGLQVCAYLHGALVSIHELEMHESSARRVDGDTISLQRTHSLNLDFVRMRASGRAKEPEWTCNYEVSAP
jgi:hypothetical protein